MKTDDADGVRAYYERNTRLFLALGVGSKARAIHRAVWTTGVHTAEEAFNLANRLVLQEAEQLPAKPLRVLDLGCGVGGSLFYLARRLEKPLHTTGVTISPLQVKLAREQAEKLSLQGVCRFIEGDFMALPELEPANLVFSIEACVHAPNPQRYFVQARRALKPGGRLIVCDDFLSDHAAASTALTERKALWLLAYRQGWRVPGLSSVRHVARMAGESGLRLASDRDLTSDLRLIHLPASLVSGLIPYPSSIPRPLRRSSRSPCL